MPREQLLVSNKELKIQKKVLRAAITARNRYAEDKNSLSSSSSSSATAISAPFVSEGPLNGPPGQVSASAYHSNDENCPYDFHILEIRVSSSKP